MQTSYDDDFLTIRLTRYEADKIRRGFEDGRQCLPVEYLYQTIRTYALSSPAEKDPVPDPGEHGELFPIANRQGQDELLAWITRKNNAG